MRMKKAVTLFLALALAGCVATEGPLPQDYKGPTALLSDSGFREGGSKAQFFVAYEIDGRAIHNSIFASRSASHGQGFALTTRTVTRPVAPGPQKVKLVGTHQTAAPIHEIASRAAGTFLSIEGVVDFAPVEGGIYTVRGELRKEGSSIWIEDDRTRQPVTAVLRSP